MELLFDRDFCAGALLSEEESRHCVKVLRHRAGDIVHVTDGAGRLYDCKIVKADARGCELEVVGSKEVGGGKPTVHIAVAPTKNNDRLEWAVEKMTEIGVTKITPLICERSERERLRIDRLEKIVIAACKQSLKCVLPEVSEPTTFEDLIESTTEEERFILHCGDTPKPHLFEAFTAGRSAIVLIGPEGDFSPTEVKRAIEKGYKECTLGEERLRTETAAVVADNIIALKNQINK